jgi:TPR repeat protein
MSEDARGQLQEAEDGDMYARLRLLDDFDRGCPPPVERHVLLSWLEQAAGEGVPIAQFRLAVWILRGDLGPIDAHKAAGWLLAVANEGLGPARDILGRMHAEGLLPDSLDFAEEVRRWAGELEQADLEAKPRLQGIYSPSGGGLLGVAQAASEFLLLVSNQANPGARSGPGGHNALAPDYAEAEKWLRLAADQGFAPAQYNLGVYQVVHHVPPDYAEAAKWYRKAAEQGHAEAQYQLGLYWSSSHAPAPDFAEAAKWLGLAAGQGHVRARAALDLRLFGPPLGKA